MEVIFGAPQKLGNRVYKKGKQTVPSSLAHNRAFHALVKSGAVVIVPRDEAKQKIQMSHDARAHQLAKQARLDAKQKLIDDANKSAADPSAEVPSVDESVEHED